MTGAEAPSQAKLNALIDSMGEFMGKCLSIKDPDTGPAQHWTDDSPAARRQRAMHKPVADVMHHELRYIPT